METIADIFLIRAICVVGCGSVALILLLLGVYGVLACMRGICDFINDWRTHKNG